MVDRESEAHGLLADFPGSAYTDEEVVEFIQAVEACLAIAKSRGYRKVVAK